jgi:hypothetical protein
MSINDSNYIEIRNKIIEGSRLAIKKLIEDRKKTNGELVIMVKGQIKHIPAKDL